MSIFVRRFTPDDVPDIINIFQQAIRQTAAKDYNRAQIAAWSMADVNRWRVRQLNRPTWIAFIGERAAGFSDLESNGHLDMMFVHPDFAKKGVATALLKQIEKHAEAEGLQRIFVESSITAKPFFEKHGFAVIKEQTVEIRGQQLTNFQMEKFL